MKSRIAAVCVVAAMALGVASTAEAQARPKWNLKIDNSPYVYGLYAKGPIRTADVTTPLGKDAVTEILAGPTNGSTEGYLMFTRMPSGAHGPALFTLPDEHFFIVLEGTMNLQIGTNKFVLNKFEGAFIPANTPHEVWNDGAGEERHFEVVAPGSSRDLLSMVKPAQPRAVPDAATLIRKPTIPPAAGLPAGLNGAQFASTMTGAKIQFRMDSCRPGGPCGPPPHVHKFQQVYFETEGETTVEYGLLTYKLPKYSLVVIQPGVVHTNRNESTAVERHVTLLMPQLTNGEPADIEYERVDRPAQAPGQAPAGGGRGRGAATP